MERLKAVKLHLYEQYFGGSITREAYLEQKVEADQEIAEANGKIRKEETRMRELEDTGPQSAEGFDAVCGILQETDCLTSALAHTFLKAVYVHPDGHVELAWKFQNPFDETLHLH